MKTLKNDILIGLIFLISSIICLFLLLNSHRTFNTAIKNNLPTESLRPIYLYDIVIILFLGLIGLVSLIFVFWKVYKKKNKNALQHRV